MTDTPPPTDSGTNPPPKPAVPPPAPAPAPAPPPPPAPTGKPVPPAAAKPPPAQAKPIDSRPTESRPTEHRRSAGPVLTVIGLALLALGLAWVWAQQQNLAASFDPNRITTLESQVANLRVRVSRLEQQQPAPAPSVDLRPLEARVAALEQRPAAPAAPPAESPEVAAQLTALQKRVAEAEQAQAGTAARAAKLARLQAATAALAAGRPLGTIPGAPPALARFATVPPPTEAALRLEFDAAAARAAEASRPATEADSLAERMWLRVQSLVTVRDGDRVLSGAPATVVLGAARAQLTAGNLAGAVADVERLDKAAADAMADWHDRARALLDARAALAKLAAAD